MESKKFVVNLYKEPYEVYIGRPSEFGNPYSHMKGTLAQFQVKNRDEAVDKFEEYVKAHPELIPEIKTKLKNKVLGCFCKPLKCHGDILARIANEDEGIKK